MNYKIPMSSPDIGDLERESVEAVMRTSSLSMGPKIGEFESAFRQFIGCRETIGVNSGTSGLHLTLRATGIEPGDIVITTPFSFVSSTNVILFEQGIPVFVDVDEKTANLNVNLVRQCALDLLSGGKNAQKWLPRKYPLCMNNDGQKKQPTLKAILAVDVFGQPADYDPLEEICHSSGITLIEDSCEALGGEYKHKKVGNFGRYGVFAFYPNKQITTGEGGMIVTDDENAANFMRALRNQGRAPGDTWLQHTHLGYNYRMDELSAAIGVAQMMRIQSLLNARKQVADWYNARLARNPSVSIPYIHPHTTAVSWFVYVIRFRPEIDRDKAAAILEKKGIPVRPYFLPIHLQPYMVERFDYRPGDYPVTENLGKCGLALPFSGKMTQSQVNMVCDELEEYDSINDLKNPMQQEFPPLRRRGILFHAIAFLLLGGGVAGSLWMVSYQQAGVNLIVFMLSTLLFFIPLPVVAYRGYSLLSGSYRIERDGVRIRWGLRVEDIPLTTIEWIRMSDELVVDIPLPRFTWPGAILGSLNVADLGRVEYLASDNTKFVLVATPVKVFILSPADPAGFIRAYRNSLEMGSLSPISSYSARPAVYLRVIWKDKLARYAILCSIILNLALFMLISLLVPLRKSISLGFDASKNPWAAGPAERLFMFPLFSIILCIIDLSVGLIFYRRNDHRNAGYLLWLGAGFAPVLLIIATLISR